MTFYNGLIVSIEFRLNFNKISKNIRNEISLYRKEFQQIMSFLTDAMQPPEFVKLCCTTYKKVLIFEKNKNDFCTRIFNKIKHVFF